jgi:hypothetical protein
MFFVLPEELKMNEGTKEKAPPCKGVRPKSSLRYKRTRLKIKASHAGPIRI